MQNLYLQIISLDQRDNLADTIGNLFDNVESVLFRKKSTINLNNLLKISVLVLHNKDFKRSDIFNGPIMETKDQLIESLIQSLLNTSFCHVELVLVNYTAML